MYSVDVHVYVYRVGLYYIQQVYNASGQHEI